MTAASLFTVLIYSFVFVSIACGAIAGLTLIIPALIIIRNQKQNCFQENSCVLLIVSVFRMQFPALVAMVVAGQ